ncbi:unnamed protein product [Enterobius vermicularis]|uniref:Structural maintenance of chromosomes protein 5 n=1 Tax=Enterobius vermicularis TaxID=51028 RepID=A0A0N4V6G7_ENTVE|nr:unnamed protein product [Enterobius vermicularis]
MARCQELKDQARSERQFELYRRNVFTNNSLSKKFMYFEALRWYEEHKSEFQYPVYVPLLSVRMMFLFRIKITGFGDNGSYDGVSISGYMLKGPTQVFILSRSCGVETSAFLDAVKSSMTLSSAESARYLENLIASRDYLVFIFGSREDEMRLTNSSFPWKISSTVLTQEKIEENKVEKGLPDWLRKYGFHHMVSDLYDAPPPVKAYLNRLFSLRKIPIGNADTDRRLEEVCKAIKDQYRLFLTETSRVQIGVSKYSGETVLRINSLKRDSSWLSAHVRPSSLMSEADKLQKKRSLEKVITEVKELQKNYSIEKGKYDVTVESLRQKMAELRKRVDAVNIINQQLRSKKIKLATLEENKPNLEEAERAFNKVKQMVWKEGYSTATEILKLLTGAGELMENIILKKLKLSIVSGLVNKLVGELTKSRANHAQKKADLEEFRETVDAKRRLRLESSERLKASTGLTSTDSNKLVDTARETLEKLQTKFESIAAPDDIETLRSVLNSERARLVVMQDEGGRTALDRYQQLLETHQNLKKHLEGSSGQVELWEKEIDALLAEWLQNLRQLIANINRNFERYFSCLGCSGEICLDEPEDKRDISGYGLGIMVKFRNGERLRRLTHKTQSGGERSVTTMLFLLSLQELCPVPFRCVDEINQGMDPNNERMVFEMMVDLLSDAGNLSKTQYFLLTPKLLPGLNYGEKAVVHCIYNGIGFPDKVGSYFLAFNLCSRCSFRNVPSEF